MKVISVIMRILALVLIWGPGFIPLDYDLGNGKLFTFELHLICILFGACLNLCCSNGDLSIRVSDLEKKVK